MIPPISRDSAYEILEPYLEALGQCIWLAWARWKSETLLPVPVAKRSRASLVYDYAADEARRTLSDIPGLKVTESRGFVLVCVEGRLMLRFKKFDSRLRTSGIPTKQQLQFAYQQMTFEELGPLPALTVGYLLDDFELEISRVAITCSVGRRVIWAIELPPGESGTVETIAPAPVKPPAEPVVRSTRIAAEEASDKPEEAES